MDWPPPWHGGKFGGTGLTVNRENLKAYTAWAAVCLVWGTTYLAIRIGLETVPPMLLAALRFIAAGSLMLAFMWGWRRARLPHGREWLDQAVIGLLLLGIGNGLVVLAELWIPSGFAALLVATSPFWVAGLERIGVTGERVGLRSLAGMSLGLAGLAVLVAPDILDARFGSSYLLGAVSIQIACAAWSGGSVFSKRRPSTLAPLMGAAIQTFVAGVALLIVGTALGEWGSLRFSSRSLAALLYLVFFGSIIAYGSYTYAIRHLPLSILSTYSYINPLIAVLLGWAIASEPLNWRVGVATLIILAGVALVKTAPGRKFTAGKKPIPEPVCAPEAAVPDEAPI